MLPSLPPEEITALTRLADGSPGRALALVEAGGLGLLHEMESVLAGLPRFDELALDRHTEKVARAGDEAMAVLRDLLLWWIAARVRSGFAEAGTRGAGLDRWARLWENTRRLFERAEAASLDRKQALLEIFYDIQSTACAT
jgi:DNA polymerase-3 subunit delta'